MKTMKTIITVALIIMMSGMAVAEGDQIYGMMNSTCPNCTGIPDLPCAPFDVTSADVSSMEVTTTSGVMIEEEWAYGRKNVCPTGTEYVYWDFEEGSNLGTFKNEHPDVAVFEDVSVTGCFGNNEPSYVRRGATMGPKCRCDMYIYPNLTTFSNGTELPYIHIVNGYAAFSPRVIPLPDGCYWPGCRAFIGFKDDTHFVSFLTSTNWNLYVRLYDKRGNYLGGRTIYYTTDRVGDGPSNFTRFTAHMDKEIGYMTFSGLFNGWHIDDLIVGGNPGYLPDKPVDYTDVARLAEELYGVRYLEYGLGHDYVVFEYLDPWQFHYPYVHEHWNPETKTFKFGEGISDEGLVLWAYNKVTKELYGENVVKWSTVERMMKHDFTVPVESADTVPADVYFMDHDFDEKPDWVGMVVEETPTGMNLIGSYDGISEGENIGVIYSKKSIVENSPAFMGYYRLPGVIKGGHNPIPKGH